MAGIADSIIQTLGSVGTGLLGFFGQRESNKSYERGVNSTNDTNLQLAREQNDFNLDMWNRQNEYNDPRNQMSRLTAAGVNPIYASGMMNGGQAESLQSVPLANQQAPQQTPSDVLAGIQAGNIQAQTLKALQEATRVKHENDKTDAETDILKSDARFRDAVNQGQLDLTNSAIKLQSSSTNLNNEQISYLRKQVSVLDASLGQISASIENLREQSLMLSEQRKEQIIKNSLTGDLIRAEIRKLYSDVSLNEANRLCSIENVKAIQEMVIGLQRDNTMKAQNILINGNNYLISQETVEQQKSLTKMLDFQISTKELNFGIEGAAKLFGAVGSLLGGMSPYFNKSAGSSFAFPFSSSNTSWSQPIFGK